MESTNGVSSTRETYLRKSFVFSNAMPMNQQRSYISTSIVNDSYAFGDDLRKYPIHYLDLVFRICPTIRRLIQGTIFSSLWFSRLLKFKDFLTKSKFLESESRKIKGSYLITKIMKFKFDNSQRNALLLKENVKSTEIKLTN